jgi:hypothetical protein
MCSDILAHRALVLSMHMLINLANIFQQVCGYCYRFDAHEVLIFVSDKCFFNLH